MQKFWRSVIIWQSYREFKGGNFLDTVLLKGGKAAGMDGLTAEHLFYAPPVVIRLLSFLFQLIVHFGLVPTDFACGLIIPLVKNSDGDIKFSNNYCGITLNPVVSSVRTGVDGNGWW